MPQVFLVNAMDLRHLRGRRRSRNSAKSSDQGIRTVMRLRSLFVFFSRFEGPQGKRPTFPISLSSALRTPLENPPPSPAKSR